MSGMTLGRAAALVATLGRMAALAIALITAGACDNTPSAPRTAAAAGDAVPAAGAPVASATPVRDGATVAFSFVVYAACANGGQGEVLQANGQLAYKGTWLTSAGERVHHAVVESFTGSATGWESGETYDVQTREVAQGSVAYGQDGIPDSGEDMQRLQLRLTSQVTGLVIDIVLSAHYVQVPSGDFVLDGWESTARCR